MNQTYHIVIDAISQEQQTREYCQEAKKHGCELPHSGSADVKTTKQRKPFLCFGSRNTGEAFRAH
jgi:hypothetical protein